MEIVWKDIVGFEGLYQISNKGEVKSLGNNFSRKEKLLKFDLSKEYPKLELFKNGVRNRKLLHRLIAEHFIPNPENLPFVNHIDNNRSNYQLDNLEWCTPKYNVNHYFKNFHSYKNTEKESREKKIKNFIEKLNITKDEILKYF